MTVNFVKGDIRDFEFKGRFDYCIHAPHRLLLRFNNAEDEMTSVIVNGTKRVIEFAQTTGASRLLC